jgi:ATP-dependent DNA helicase 2 subunit 2
VGCDLLMKKLGENKKGNKRLCLITDAESPVREPAEGTVEQQAKAIAERMGEQGIKLDAVVVRMYQNLLTHSAALQKNEALLDIFKLHTQTEVGVAWSAMSMLGIMRPRIVSPTTLYRGDFELTPTMTLKVPFKPPCYSLNALLYGQTAVCIWFVSLMDLGFSCTCEG